MPKKNPPGREARRAVIALTVRAGSFIHRSFRGAPLDFTPEADRGSRSVTPILRGLTPAADRSMVTGQSSGMKGDGKAAYAEVIVLRQGGSFWHAFGLAAHYEEAETDSSLIDSGSSRDLEVADAPV